MRGYDVNTGKLLWSNPAKAFNTYGSLFRLTSGKDLVACFQWGFFTRVRDGKMIWDKGVFGDSVCHADRRGRHDLRPHRLPEIQ